VKRRLYGRGDRWLVNHTARAALYRLEAGAWVRFEGWSADSAGRRPSRCAWRPEALRPTRLWTLPPATRPAHLATPSTCSADGLLVIDYPRKLVSFSRRLALSSTQAGALPYERPFRVPVSIGDRRLEGNLDTGANVAFVLPRALFDTASSAPTEPVGEGRLANTTVDTMRATVRGPFVIGQASLEDVEVRVSARYPELLVGAHALQRFVVLIDQRSRSVAVCR
jgi:predicted aspartyl protease